jgi:uncharacterized phage protein gp47/JayE
MPDVLDFLPLYPSEDEGTVRARWDAWANEGVDPVADPDEYVDTRQVGFFYMATQPGVQETARVYDFMGSEVIAAAFPATAWGSYLDLHAGTYGLERLAATYATGEVTFTGLTAEVGTQVDAGVTVAVAPVDDEDPASFVVTADTLWVSSGILSTATAPIRAADAGTGGNVAAGAITILESTVTGATSVTNADSIDGGTEIETDDALRDRILARFQETSAANVATYRSWALKYAGVGRVRVIAEGLGPGSVVVIVQSLAGDAVSESIRNGLQDALDPAAAATLTTNSETFPTATVEVDSTVGFRSAGWFRVNGVQLVSYTGITSNSFTGCSGGTGTFAAGSRIEQGGRGGGIAPVGHHVIVQTAGTIDLPFVAVVEFDDGFSLDGTGGTVALREEIEEAIRAYGEYVQSGDEIVRNRMVSAIMGVEGVHDTGSVTINGVAANYQLSSSPPVSATFTTITLTEGVV